MWLHYVAIAYCCSTSPSDCPQYRPWPVSHSLRKSRPFVAVFNACGTVSCLSKVRVLFLGFALGWLAFFSRGASSQGGTSSSRRSVRSFPPRRMALLPLCGMALALSLGRHAVVVMSPAPLKSIAPQGDRAIVLPVGSRVQVIRPFRCGRCGGRNSGKSC